TNRARRAGEFVRDQNVGTRSLDDLKGKRHVGRTRHAWHVALEFRIAEIVPRLVVADVDLHPVFEVALPLGERRRLVRNLPAFHDALSRRPSAVRAEQLRVRPRLRLVVFEVDIRGDERLPQAVQVGTTIGQARRLVGRERLGGRRLLTGGRSDSQTRGDHGARPAKHYHASGPVAHVYPSFSNHASHALTP